MSIDLPEGESGGGYRACRAQLHQTFAGPGQHLHLLRGDSHAPQMVHQVRDLVGPVPIDLLFIDGDHTYEGVKPDFSLYAPLVANGGLIALHGVVPRTEEPRIVVWRFWQEIREQHKEALEWVDRTPGGREIGIGLLRSQR